MHSQGRSILIVDDEPDLLELVRYNLQAEGYKVLTARDGIEGLKAAKTEPLDLAILDLMMPGMDGNELCRAIRSNPATANLPVIMLTAKSDDVDKIASLELGADDYITKPFNPRELVARVRALLRRSERGAEGTQPAARLVFGRLAINRAEYTVQKDDLPVELSPTEYKLLLYMAERRGRVLTRDNLLDAVWSDEACVVPRTVDVHIRRLRTQIEDDPANPRYIMTRRGVGYYFDAADVEEE